jgi:hypothetical protein
VHEAGQTEEPGWGHEVRAAEDHKHLYVHTFVEIVLPTDTVGHEELSTVDNQSGEVTEKKHDDNTDEDTSKIHLVVGRTVPV